MAKRHFESDGDGGFYVSKSALAIVITLITILATFASVVAMSTTMKNDISSLQSGATLTQDISRNNREEILVLKEKIDQMSRDVTEIKRDVKEIKEDIN